MGLVNIPDVWHCSQADIVDLLGSDGVGAVPQVSELNAKVEKVTQNIK